MNGEVIWQASDSYLTKELHDLCIKKIVLSNLIGHKISKVPNHFSDDSVGGTVAEGVHSLLDQFDLVLLGEDERGKLKSIFAKNIGDVSSHLLKTVVTFLLRFEAKFYSFNSSIC